MQPKYLNKNQSNQISQNLNHISYPYPDLRKNEKKEKLTGGSSLYVRISQFLHAPLGYRCRFEWYNSGKGTDEDFQTSRWHRTNRIFYCCRGFFLLVCLMGWNTLVWFLCIWSCSEESQVRMSLNLDREIRFGF